MRILGFWHIANVGAWQRIWPGQLEHFKSSGLYEATERLRVVLAGVMDADLCKTADTLVQEEKVSLKHYPDREVFEFPILGRIQELAAEAHGGAAARDVPRSAGAAARPQSEPFFAYYIHVKGACTANHDRKDESPAYWWKEFMEHWVVGRWRDCVHKLELGYDTAGIEWRESPAPHYSGNFWWARSEYLARLPVMGTGLTGTPGYWAEHRSDRVMAEMYIGRANPKYCELKRYGQDLYRFKVTPEMWD